MSIHSHPQPLSLAPEGVAPQRVSVLCFEGVHLADLLSPFRLTARRVEVDLVATRASRMRTACGAPVRVLTDIGAARPAALVVPCDFIRSGDFATGEAVPALADLVAGTARVLFLARGRREARRAHLMLARPPMMPSGRFWRLFDGPAPQEGAELVRDGHATWAIGQGAIAAAGLWLDQTAVAGRG